MTVEFKEKLLHELRLIDEQRFRRIKIFEEQHKTDDVFVSQENLDNRDLDKDQDEEDLDDMNYMAMRLARRRFNRRRDKEHDAEREQRIHELGAKIKELEARCEKESM